MKKFLNMLIGASISTIFLSLPNTVAKENNIDIVKSDVGNSANVQTAPDEMIGESPPIDPITNLPVEMTALEDPQLEIINEYVVEPGDSLSKIAADFVLDVETLKKWNNLVSDIIQVGQTLSVNGQVEPTPEQIAALEAAERRRVQSQQNQNNTQNNLHVTNAPIESAPTADASNLIEIAYQYLGAPYAYGGTTPSGFDCSGYVSYVFMQAGKLSSNNSAITLYNMAQKVSTPQVGDLVFFSGTYRAGISHVGIYIGNNLMINAAGNRVQINNIYDSYWGKHFTGFGRI